MFALDPACAAAWSPAASRAPSRSSADAASASCACRSFRQMRNLMREAQRSSEPAGEKLLELLDRRLDNVIWRAGFAASIPAARRL
jgi:ribosomal protein S4